MNNLRLNKVMIFNRKIKDCEETLEMGHQRLLVQTYFNNAKRFHLQPLTLK